MDMRGPGKHDSRNKPEVKISWLWPFKLIGVTTLVCYPMYKVYILRAHLLQDFRAPCIIILHFKKRVGDFPVPSRDVTIQTLPRRE